MESLLSSAFFARNRQKLKETVKHLPIVIAGNGLLQRTADTTFAFTQESNFWYLTGLNVPDMTLVIGAEEEYLIVPERSAVRAAFDGAITPSIVTARSGITLILEEREGWKRLKHSILEKNIVSTLEAPQQYVAAHGFYTNPAKQRLIDKIIKIDPDIQIVGIQKELTSLRSIKQAEEVTCIRTAVDITKDTLAELTEDPAFAEMRHEYEVEAAIGAAFRRRGASGHAYSPIVAAGAHATTLHYVSNDGEIGAKDYIVLDVGAEVEHYAADITRTVIQGKPTARQRAVHIAVQAVQHETLALMKPGASLKKIERQVELSIGRELKSLGLITNARDVDGVRRYYPHAVSHFLGLDVHDVGDYRLPLAPGMVLTCEPGIYIPEEGIGVRIEDDVLITDTGNIVL
jgi:Xaa-Pro aminopeptidase